jgi:geranylgeranyl diphosphate synthase type II
MRYSVLGGGKRIRAFLVLAFADLGGGREDAALPFACAMECLHAYSLIHDDLPAMDNDDLRRGKPSCHIAFGESAALLAGDALLTYAFELLASDPSVSAKSVREAVLILSREAGEFSGMVGGQTLDMALSVDSLGELQTLFLEKTCALLKASCLLGLYAATDSPDPDLIDRAERYARALGLAFQIRDDILDATSTVEALGKPVGSDLQNDKKNALRFLSLEEAQNRVRELTAEAVDAVSGIEGGEALADLAALLAERRS